ncbi:hypothetical protein MPTK1_4g06470 [Marchantia polymorpha subsp. ruderalis]|uniref:T-complex protein 11 n=2 Tax=Marchantia polymorpha TaxID=3197 RepID=A0A176W2G4_MARPO|nr:hypothetical protein AXG93_641s1060 [Marchantia polymorpha subsp. ruderalis]PTQ31174.1 hypothetical protein MARPO_0114s0005 [Marchantia polymorpha]PTQ31175.1 hypothetical protein MARPO_0114s0005 [Marchantia polymorpha]PTQ31176.1 hypothetical protein MARPO_0114s0005 [Marchantia polymorpha]BBN07792.1 hypothetical protein Mp_4g06470 [Marchantia polymorpha subsp. ruderalis]|eukprot:PTQ31174.1 hypothetical protein MARPO_0114s0005 [Marchantia polymorpha]
MAASVTINLGSLSGGRILNPPPLSVAFEIEISECTASTSPIPKRVRRRLQETTESKSKFPASLEDIEIKLKEADSRRQQFHEWLANKARPKPKLSPSHPQAEDLAQRLEAKLSAAEQKRAELLAHEQTRLAKLHELRVAAKTEAQLRAEREREELGSKVEFRVQQAETNRLALLEAEKQRRAAVHERIAQSVIHRTTKEGRDRDRIEALRATICQKIAAAEEKRAGILEAEKNRAQACVLQARRVAKAVVRERELEMRKKKEKLEARLQRAKRQRAEYLMKRGGCRGACHNHGHKLHKHGDRLCRKLTRCWRQFRGSRRTTYALAQEYAACAINQELVVSLPFEQLASRITSPATLRSVKPLLARIESRLMLSSAGGQFSIGQIDHLLKRLFPSRRKTGGPSVTSAGKKGSAGLKGSKESVKVDEKEMERYPARVFLCAYMILGQPDAVFSGRGEREVALAEAAAKLLPEFEALLSIILDGPSSTPLRPSSPSGGYEKKNGWTAEQQDHQNSCAFPAPQRPFSVQMATFDAAWCSYLYQFVAWKVKDAQLLEEDLTRMACQLEVSMLQKCKDTSDFSHDSQAIRRQVLEDQKLLRDRILHLTGNAGASRMEDALSEVRTKFNEALENGSPLPSPFSSPPVVSRTPISPPPTPSPFLGSFADVPEESSSGSRAKVVRHLFKPADECQSMTESVPEDRTEPGAQTVILPSMFEVTEPAFTNEKIVHEMLHDPSWQMMDPTQHKGTSEPLVAGGTQTTKVEELQAQIRETMESAFWDGIVHGLLESPPEYGRVVSLVGEIRKEFENIIPEKWKQDLLESMDLELLSQILESGSYDFEYLRHLLDYASGLILKLGAPIRDSETKAAHQSLLTGLSVSPKADGETQRAFANAMVKGLRFIFEQLQVLKKDISSSRLRALAPMISGSAGVDYMRKAFASRFNVPAVMPASVSDIAQKLPRTAAWIGEVEASLEQDREEFETSVATVRANLIQGNGMTAGLPPLPSMRTGGRLGAGGFLSHTDRTAASVGDSRPRTVDWKSTDTVLRLGILSLVRHFEPAFESNVPETLTLNVERLRNCQNDFQRIIVMATGLLVARQGLTGRGVVGAELDMVMELGREKLDALLNESTATIAQIGALLAQISSNANSSEASPEHTAYCELMTRVLAKSLSPDDAVFARVSAAVGASLRAVLLLGKGTDGLAMAELALKRIGGSILLDKVTSAAEALEKIVTVTCRVHEPWYACIITNVP